MSRFLSGAALTHLHLVLSQEDVPQTLLRERLALRAAEACVAHQGRPERSSELRDAVGFLQPGDGPGPAGEIFLSWRRALERPASVKMLHRALPDVDAKQVAMWLDAGQGAPIARAAVVLQVVLEDRPRDPTVALVLAEASLAQALGWNNVVPLLALGLKRGDLRKTGADLRCHGPSPTERQILRNRQYSRSTWWPIGKLCRWRVAAGFADARRRLSALSLAQRGSARDRYIDRQRAPAGRR